MEKRPLISQRTLNVFYDLLSGYEVVRTIEKMFEVEDIFRDSEFTSSFTTARRSMADEYVNSLDLSKPKDANRLLRVIDGFAIKHEDNEYLHKDADWKQFLKLLERDGYLYENGRFQRTKTYQNNDIEELAAHYGMEHVLIDWERAISQIETDPEDAITAARSMLESTCLWILDTRQAPYKKGADLPDLYKSVGLELNLSPDQHGEQIFKQILGSLSGVINGMAAVRNAYGDSHGKGTKYYRPSARHARFVVNLCATLSTFLVESHLIRDEQTTR